jgi:uncharacterized protein (DUF488 family)
MAELSRFDLLTVGHSNHPLERFLALLKTTRVSFVADVRSRPFSRRFPWFSHTRLSAHLGREGIAYLAFGDTLGGRPADSSLFRESIVDYEAVARSDAFRSGLDAVLGHSRGQRLCLMCAEREPLECHRCLLVARALAERGCTIGHILADGAIEPHAETEDRLLKLTKIGSDLFASDRSMRLAEAYRRRARAFAFRI